MPSAALTRLARKCDLVLVTPEDLTWARRKAGKGFSYRNDKGRPIKDAAIVQRLASLAVPPAYGDVRYAPDPRAHLQAVGRDAAGRLQYRYHPDWEKVREWRKAKRLAKLAAALPKIRRTLSRHLATEEVSKDFALAAVVELVALTAIRAGSETYAKEHGTRGATTLLKSHVRIEDEAKAVLAFTAKGGVRVEKEVCMPRFVAVLQRLKALPGRRLFQYRGADGALHPVRAGEVNAFLKEMSGAPISLKDFRTLVASAGVLETLAQTIPAGSARARRAQVLEAVRTAAEELANTPTVCRKSYVHATVVTAFEEGTLERFARLLKGCRSPQKRAEVLAQIVARTRLEAADAAGVATQAA
ncbi:DNA topoisomerase I [Azorhizobium oxalatiphilum]|uniref:DNA topoisomerase I n=1 Tax=Azorhizobium oxalatiphilum TaxID=980631 RepID=A0A917FB94_9HYPH|nr:DNA topoisomerase IB [Azorhizobium oxalatiphilum]GGF64435.1 DNA topoisomerase I [Azorhizobium oxalatiphilum]